MRNDIRRNIQRMRASFQDASPEQSQQSTFPTSSSALLRQCREFVAAVEFLSVIPVPGSARLFRTGMGNTHFIMGSGYFSLVGFLLGLFTCLIPWLLGTILPPLALAALVVVALVVLTGGLHLDGLMDTCDGVLGRADRDRKLEIMRDSRVGSFGVLGAVCILLLKYALLASISLPLLMMALLIIPATARWGVILAVRIFPSARAAGMGAAFRQTVTIPRLLLAGLLALLIACIFGHLMGLFIWSGATIAAIVIGAWMTQLLGGLTGDIYGAIIEVTEVIALLLLVLVRFWF